MSSRGKEAVEVLDQNPEQVRILNVYFKSNKHQKNLVFSIHT